ncbi:ATP-binding protein [Planomonospora algeriensis]
MEVPDVEAALDAILSGRRPGDLESPRLDFKRQGRSREDTAKDLAQAAACFANSSGGVLVVGVRDSLPGPEAFEGCDLDEDGVALRVYQLTVPPLSVVAEVRHVLGKRLLVITVPRTPEVHQVDGRATWRVGDQCLPLAGHQIAALVEERRGIDWSAAPTGRPIGDASPIALEVARELLNEHPDPARQGYARMTDADLVRLLGLVSPEGTLNRAGDLLMCSQGTEGGELLHYQFRRSSTGDLLASEWYRQPMLRALTGLLDAIGIRTDRTSIDVRHGVQIQVPDLPLRAVREAVVNAAIHRDYRLPGRIQIEQSPTRLVVTSPGRLVPGITLENILTMGSRPRNGRLCGAIRALGLAEEAGVGVDRMYGDMLRVGHHPPLFEEGADYVRVTLRGGAPNAAVARYVATLPADVGKEADTLLVLFTLLSRKTITAADMAPLLQRNIAETEDVLRSLSGPPADMLETTRASARLTHPAYRLREDAVAALGSAVTYRRRKPDDTDRKIIDLVREVGYVNARLVTMTVGLHGAQASRFLSDLVSRGLLTRTSQASRGPGVRYGPGPRFPEKSTRKQTGPA